METNFQYTFPAIRGVQACREYYVSMCPLRLIPKLFIFNNEELVPELRAQRVLNKARIPDIARYIVGNRKSYVFSAITASINGNASFEPLNETGEASRVGILKVDMHSQFIINDGQHRRAAIEAALKSDPKLGDEAIAVVLFLDRGLSRCQQMFADLNRYAIRPSKSLGVMYDHRDDMAHLARLVVLRSEPFRDVVEMEKTSLSKRSRKLFTLSAIYAANRALLDGKQYDSVDSAAIDCAEYWDEVAKHIPEWRYVRDAKMTAGDVRQEFIHSHSITLQALGAVGHELMGKAKTTRKRALSNLRKINWARSNAKDWEGRAMLGGSIAKSGRNVTLTINLIKKKLGISLTPDERRIEDAYSQGRRHG